MKAVTFVDSFLKYFFNTQSLLILVPKFKNVEKYVLFATSFRHYGKCYALLIFFTNR